MATTSTLPHSETSKALPKSLHTVTVLVAVAKLIQDTKLGYSAFDAVYQALVVLGYSSEEDHYSLALQALKKLNKA
jgi:hypothetical protein